jgi:hypothetical protein
MTLPMPHFDEGAPSIKETSDFGILILPFEQKGGAVAYVWEDAASAYAKLREVVDYQRSLQDEMSSLKQQMNDESDNMNLLCAAANVLRTTEEEPESSYDGSNRAIGCIDRLCLVAQREEDWPAIGCIDRLCLVAQREEDWPVHLGKRIQACQLLSAATLIRETHEEFPDDFDIATLAREVHEEFADGLEPCAEYRPPLCVRRVVNVMSL